LSTRIACFGEVLWDVFPSYRKLGGAPLNVAAHLCRLGSEGSIISRIGEDELGEELLQNVQEIGVDISYLQADATFDTGTVYVTVDNDGIPTYEIKYPTAWDHIEINFANTQFVAEVDALLFGTLPTRSQTSYETLLHLAARAKKNIFDLNVRQDFYSKEIIHKLLTISQILKINEDESVLLSDMFGIEEKDLLTELTDQYQLELIIRTRGADGSEVFKAGEYHRVHGEKITVVDTVGAGDAFLACFLHYYLGGYNIEESLILGGKLGAFVATQEGAIPDYRLAEVI